MIKKLMVKHLFIFTRQVTVAVCLLGLPYGGIYTSLSEVTYNGAVDIITELQSYQSPSGKPHQSEGQLLEVAPLSTEGESSNAVLDQDTFYAIADATVLQGYPSVNFGDTIDMWAGYDEYLDPDGEIARSLIQFDIASLPANQTITKATLRVYLVNSWDYPDTSRTIRTYRILSEWSEGNVNWNTSPSFGDAYGSRSITSGDWGWYEFDVTSLISEWYDGTYQNHGVMLRGPEVSGTDSSWRGFGTRESEYTPELVVEYTSSNTAPVISGLPDQVLGVNSSSDNAIDLWAYTNDIEDIDADLIFTISNTPAVSAGVTIDSNRYIDINPDTDWTGSTDVEVQVQDTGSLIDTDAFHLTVTGEAYHIYLPLVIRNIQEEPNNPPNTPSNPLPVDGVTDQSVNIDVNWTGGDPDGDTVTYDVYFEAGDSSPDVLLCNDTNNLYCDPGTLSYNTHYYWQVVATDQHGASSTGPVWDFTTQAQPNTPLTYYLCHDGSYILSTGSCLTGYLLAGSGTETRFETTLTGDIDGTDYEFAISMATDLGITPLANVDVMIILDKAGQETVLASTSFIVDNDRGGSPPYNYILYTDSVTGIDPDSSSGDHLILRFVNNGPGNYSIKWGSDNSSITIPGVN